jgi:zinc protease
MAGQNGVSIPNSKTITREVLPNGIVVLIYENHAAQSVVVSGSLRAGSQYETPEKNGLAALVASALMRGTATRDFNALAAALEDIGADLGHSAGNHRVGFFGKALAEDLDTLLDVLADTLCNPTFPHAQVERLRGEVITGLQIRQQDTRYRASRAFHEALYPENHPYHYSVRGSLDSVSNLTVDDLIQFHKTHYGVDGMIIGIVGAVNAGEALEAVRARLGEWNNPDQPPEPQLPTVTPPEAQTRNVIALAGKTQADIVMGVPGPSRFAPDYLPAMLANSILGQFGMMGRIGASVREKLGLAYYAYSQMEGGFGQSPWMVAAGVNPANIELAIERSIDELRRIISEPVGADDLDDNQAWVVGRIPLQLESNEGIVSSILNMELYGLGLDYLVNFRSLIYGLTRDDLLNAARHYLTPDKLVIGVAGPA